MKKTIITLLALIAISSYSQNRYSNSSTSNYNSEVPNADYYGAIAEKRMAEIGKSYQYYTSKVNENIALTSDYQFKEDMYEVKSYLAPLAGQMSLDQADLYIRKVEELYNKAVRKYNKRLKK